MSTSGDAAEQVVRMSLEGVEAVAKISGKGALEIAKLLLAEMRKPQRTKGRASLMTMLRQGKPIKVFEIDDKSLRKFCEEAKKYGVMYHVLKDKNRKDGKCDIMVRKEDVPKVNRIFDRFGLGVDHKAVIQKSVARKADRMRRKNRDLKKAPMISLSKNCLRNRGSRKKPRTTTLQGQRRNGRIRPSLLQRFPQTANLYGSRLGTLSDVPL